jgi:hypothetical protein
MASETKLKERVYQDYQILGETVKRLTIGDTFW